MRNNAQIVKIENDMVLIKPLVKKNCAECKQVKCSQKINPFWVKNEKKIQVSVGDFIEFQSSLLLQAFQSFVYLILPICLCILGYFIAPFCFEKNISENERFVFVICCFVFSIVVIFLLGNVVFKRRYPVIERIIDFDNLRDEICHKEL